MSRLSMPFDGQQMTAPFPKVTSSSAGETSLRKPERKWARPLRY
jgi:hypothetical protein